MQALKIAGLIGAVYLAVVTLNTTQAKPQTFPSRYVLTEKHAYGVGESRLVSTPTVDFISWSPTGKYLLLQRHEDANRGERIEREQSIALWDVRAGRLEVVWRYRHLLTQNAGGHVEASLEGWLPKTNTAVFLLTQIAPNSTPDNEVFQISVLAVRCESGLAKTIFTAPVGKDIRLTMNPVDPVSLLETSELKPIPGASGGAMAQMGTAFSVFGSDLVVSPLASIPDKLGLKMRFWNVDATRLVVVGTERGADGKITRANHYLMDVKSGAITTLPPDSKPARFNYKERAVPPVSAYDAREALQTDGRKSRIPVIWLVGDLKSKRPKAVVATDASSAALSPNLDSVAFVSRGAVWLTALHRLSSDEFAKAMKERAIQNAKQAGLGLIMYAQDYDEIFPPADGVGDRVEPYVKDDDVFEEFQFLLNGNTLASIEKPAETMMGFIPAPGGRAIVYADGHVKWKDDDKK